MIKYFLQNPDLALTRGSDGAAGYDLRANLSSERTLVPGARWLVSTGLHLEMPLGIHAQVCSRSGLAINHGVIVLNAPGIIDSDYRGEVKVSLINLGTQPYLIIPGERIAQLLFMSHGYYRQRMPGQYCGTMLFNPHSVDFEAVESLDKLSSTARGSGGHGSTGR